MTQRRLPLSVFIIAQNEEKRIENTIRSVIDWVDEVIVVDSGSQDKTVELSTQLGAKTFHQDWLGFGGQKRVGEDHCDQHWLLNLDADEVVPQALRKEIEKLFENGAPPEAGYSIKIHNIYPGDDHPRPFANDYDVVRLYSKQAGRYRDHPVYDRVVLKDGIRVKKLRHPIHHYPLLDWQQMMEKTTRQSNSNLEKLAQKSTGLLVARLTLGFPLNFIRNYVFRGHFLGGWKGFTFALNTAYSRTMRVAKALEMKERR